MQGAGCRLRWQERPGRSLSLRRACNVGGARARRWGSSREARSTPCLARSEQHPLLCRCVGGHQRHPTCLPPEAAPPALVHEPAPPSPCVYRLVRQQCPRQNVLPRAPRPIAAFGGAGLARRPQAGAVGCSKGAWTCKPGRGVFGHPCLTTFGIRPFCACRAPVLLTFSDLPRFAILCDPQPPPRGRAKLVRRSNGGLLLCRRSQWRCARG